MRLQRNIRISDIRAGVDGKTRGPSTGPPRASAGEATRGGEGGGSVCGGSRRLNIGRGQVLELRVERRATDRAGLAADGDFVGAIHLSTVVHGNESGMCVAEVIIGGEGDGGKRYGLSEGIDAAVCNVRVRQAVKEIVGSAVFLKDDNDVLNLLRWWRWWGRYSSTAAADQTYKECD